MIVPDIVFLVIEILILLAILLEIFLGWRWHREAMKKSKKDNNKKDTC